MCQEDFWLSLYIFSELQQQYGIVQGSDDASEGNFVLSNGDPAPFYIWHSGEPNGNSSENCLLVVADYLDGLIDTQCDQSYNVAFCEVECKCMIL